MAPPEFSEEWNASCALRPVSQRNDAEVHWAYFGMSWFLIVVYAIIVPVAFVSFTWARRHSVYIRKRNYFSICMLLFGALWMPVPGPIRDVVGRQVYPCELAMWARVACMIFVPLPITTTLFYFRNQLIWSNMLSKISFNKLQEVIRDVNETEEKPFLARKSIAVSMLRRPSHLKVANNKMDDGEGSTAKSETRITTGNSSSIDEAGFLSAMKSQNLGYQLTVISLPALPTIILGLAFQFSLPYYGHGCVGCYDPFYFTIAISASIGLLVAVGVYYMFLLRNAADPFDILYEIRTILTGALALGSFGLVGYVIDEFIGAPYDRGVFSWDWLVLLTMLLVIFMLCLRPVYVSYKLSRSIAQAQGGLTASTRIDFKTLLDNLQFQQMFREHLVSEWAIENLNFYNQATRFKTHYGDFKSTQQANIVALQTYNTFIRPGSIMEVNISSSQRGRLEHIFNDLTLADLQDKASTLKIPSDVFDEARSEIVTLMEKDPFSRFHVTPRFKEFASQNMIVDPARNVLVVSNHL